MVQKLPIDIFVELKQVQDSFHSLDSFYFFLSLEHWSNCMSEKLVAKQGNGRNIIQPKHSMKLLHVWINLWTVKSYGPMSYGHTHERIQLTPYKSYSLRDASKKVRGMSQSAYQPHFEL